MAEKTKRTLMKIVAPEDRKNNYLPFISTYSEEELKEETSRCLNCPKPFCVEGCPIHNRIPEFIQFAKEEKFAEAFALIREKSCLSDICATVCPHEKQCEGHCIRNKIDEPIAIGAIERYISEWAIRHNALEVKKPNSNHIKVACIGAGPASMACAEILAEEGYEVDIFEKQDYIGGVLTWGIPSYRLKKENIDVHIKRLKDLGVSFHLNTDILKETTLEELKDKYAAIFVGTGAPIPNTMHMEGEDLEGVFDAYTFLKETNVQDVDENGRKHFDGCGKNVIVCGGGNAAMDAARNAIRLPQVESVKILYRRSEEEMPACVEELEHAKEEGIAFMTLHTPVKCMGEDGKLNMVECAIMELGEPDESGRRRPIESNQEHLFIPCDTLIMAVGFNNDPGLNHEVDTTKWGNFIIDEEGRTSLPYVYAGGDLVTGANTVVEAMKAGILAAKTIKKDLEVL